MPIATSEKKLAHEGCVQSARHFDGDPKSIVDSAHLLLPWHSAPRAYSLLFPMTEASNRIGSVGPARNCEKGNGV